MKLSETFEFLDLRNRIIDKRLPLKTSYKLTKFFNQLESESKYFNEELQKIVDEYGQRDENGDFILTTDKNGVKIKEGLYNECMAKIDELSNIEVHLDYEPRFSLEELEDLDLEIKYTNLLIPYIEEN